LADQLTDEELLKLYASSGDDTHLSALYTRYIEMIYGVCLKYFKNSSEAKDAASEVYLLLLRRAKGKEIDNWKPWLYTVVKNYCLEQLRSRSNKKPKQMAADRVYSEEVFHPSIESKDKEVHQLESCIETLEEDQKACIRMFYLEKRSYQELSDVLNLSWGQVRSRIQNGRRNLKNCMNKENNID